MAMPHRQLNIVLTIAACLPASPAARYSWEALVINELSGIDLFLSAPGVSLSLPVKGQVFLEVVGVNSQLFMVDIGVLIAMYFACCAFVVFVVCWRNRQLKH